MKQIRHFKELGFSAVAEFDTLHVDFWIYEHEAYAPNGDPEFPRPGSLTSPDPVSKYEDAAVFAHGHVKWDGCSNWAFDEQDRCMLHACDKAGLHRFGLILGECWEWAKDLPARDA